MLTAVEIINNLAVVFQTQKAVCCLWAPPALTPVQRWSAAGRFGAGMERWFILIGVVAFVVLIAAFVVVSLRRKQKERKVNENLFAEYARRRGLSEREQQIMLEIAGRAQLKRSEAIFTMRSAFELGAKVLLEELPAQSDDQAGANLRSELSFLREKLSFHDKDGSPAGPGAKSRGLSTRQIPVGKKLYITRRQTRRLSNIEAVIVKNTDKGLTVELPMAVESAPGNFWRGRYYFGASVWEFDTSAVSCSGDILVLNHSDNIRFINRRRFLRVPVRLPAFVAHFPFKKMVNSPGADEQGAAGGAWKPPGFVPAVVTELAGPGLRIETEKPLDVKTDERVLVVFGINGAEQGDLDSTRTDEHGEFELIEGIGVVRHVKGLNGGVSIAVELTGLADADISDLVRATNAASVKAGDEEQNSSPPAGNTTAVEQPASGAVVVEES